MPPFTDILKYSIPDKEMANENQIKFNMQFQLSAIKRDLVILSVGFAVLYAAMGSATDIQFALNPDESLALVVIGLFIFTRLFSCALLPTMSIDKVGNKGTLVIAYGIHLVYLLASLDPRFSTLIPTSVAAGITSSLLWTSTNVYITSLSIVYSKYSNEEVNDAEATISKFFALFYCIVYFFFSIPAILISLVINPQPPEHISQLQLPVCGANYFNQPLNAVKECNSTTENERKFNDTTTWWCTIPLYIQPPQDSAYILGGIYVALAVIAFIIILCFVRNLITGQVSTLSDPENRLTFFGQFLKNLGATFDILRENPEIFLLNFAAFCYGTVEYFLMYDFPQAFVVCVAGYHLRGYLLFTFALVASIASVFFIFIYVSYCRFWMLGVSTILVFICILPLFFWIPNDDNKGVSFIFAIFWGIVHSIWNIHLSGLCGIMGRRQLSSYFSNLYFWWTFGQLLGFAWSKLLSIQHKLYVISPLLAASTVALGALEIWLRAPTFIKSKRVAPESPKRSKPEGSSVNTPIRSTKKANNPVSTHETDGKVDINDSERIAQEIKSRESTPPGPQHAPSAPPPPDDISDDEHRPESATEAKAESEVEPEAEAEAESEVKPEAEAEAESEVEPEAESEVETEAEAKDQHKHETKDKNEPDAKTEREDEVEVKPNKPES